MKRNRLLSLTVLAILLAAGPEPALAVRDTTRPNKNKAPVIKPLPDPITLVNYRGRVGKSFYFQVTGTTVGVVWGTGIYTDDSRLATAVVHAGILGNGQKGIVKVTIVAGQSGYQGSTSNGVTSHPYGAWQGSYRIEAVPKK
jgi:hypothetical protein